MSGSSPHFATLLVTIGVGLAMCRLGFRERQLLARRTRRKCASCGRELGTRRRCERCA